MAFDREKLSRKAKEEEQRQKKSFGPKILWWKAKVGDNHLRLTPAWTSEGVNADMPFREVYRHWDIGLGGYEEGGRSFTCPVRTEGGPGGVCEICDEVAMLRNSGNPADQEVAKEIYAKRRLYSNIIDLNDPEYTESDYLEWEQEANDGDECHFEIGETKIQVFSYGSKIYDMLLDLLQDDDLGDFSDPTVSIVLKRKGQGKTGTSYTLKLDGKRGTPFEFNGDFDRLVYDLDAISPFPKEGAIRACLNGEVQSNYTPGGNPAIASGGSGNRASKKMVKAPEVEEVEEEPPECLNDAKTQDDSDPICVGGACDGDNYAPCEFVAECRKTKLAALAAKAPKKKSRRRSTKKAAPEVAVPDSEGELTVAQVEAELAAALEA